MDIQSNAACGQLQAAAAVRMATPAHCFYMVHGGKMLSAHCTLQECAIEAGTTVHAIARLKGGAPKGGDPKRPTVRITVANVTHLPTAIDALLAVEGDIYCVQEHTTGPADASRPLPA